MNRLNGLRANDKQEIPVLGLLSLKNQVLLLALKPLKLFRRFKPSFQYSFNAHSSYRVPSSSARKREGRMIMWPAWRSKARMG